MLFPLKNDRDYFEFVSLAIAQTGLNWKMILNKREVYNKAFEDFDIERVSKFTEADVKKLLSEGSGIIRNERKVVATIVNAKGFLEIAKEFGSFKKYFTDFVRNYEKENRIGAVMKPKHIEDFGVVLSKELKKRGFSFTGPSLCHTLLLSFKHVNGEKFEWDGVNTVRH